MQPDSTPTWIEMAIEIPFLIFHLSVLLFIAGEILKRNAVFSASFFLMYCIQSVADIVYYLAVSDACFRLRESIAVML